MHRLCSLTVNIQRGRYLCRRTETFSKARAHSGSSRKPPISSDYGNRLSPKVGIICHKQRFVQSQADACYQSIIEIHVPSATSPKGPG